MVAGRISAIWNFTGPSLLISSQENSAHKALQVAQFLLTFEPKIEAVVLGAIDLSAGWEHVLWCNRQHKAADNGQGFAFDMSHSGWNIGEGAGAIVLKRERDCIKDRIYARMKALQILQQSSSEQLELSCKSEYVSQVCANTLRAAGISPRQIDYLELHAGGIEQEDRAELAGLVQAYRQKNSHQIISSVKANIGHTFAASGIAALIKTALCLYHRYLPGIPNRSRPKYQDIWPQDLFHTLEQSRTWHGTSRMAAINSLGLDGSYVHIILEEASHLAKSPVVTTHLKRGKVIKLLSSGWTPLRKFILQDKHRKEFPAPNISTPQMPLRPCYFDKYIARALQRNAATELTYLRIKKAFQDNLGSLLTEEPDTLSPPGKLQPKTDIVWNTAQIIEMTDGKLSHVLGPEYFDIDSYPVRARLPLPPFMFVSRVTRLSAEPGQLKPCTIEWQYDIPKDAWYVTNGMVPGIVPFEFSHGLILALSYIGCDRLFHGKRRYRALDSSVTFLGSAPLPGDTLEGKAYIHTFIKSGQNLLIFYDYHCYVNHKEILRIKANAGFFSPKDMENIKGELRSAKEIHPKTVPLQSFTPLASCRKKVFSEEDIHALQQGDFTTCFGAGYSRQSPGLLTAPMLKMLDRILMLDRSGGLWGLGEITGEKDIAPDHWVFKAHFKNDPVLPGTMLVEGCYQLILFYMYYSGLHTRFTHLRVNFLEGITSSAKFRAEVKPQTTQILFRIHIKQIAVAPETYALAMGQIIHQSKVIGICDNIGVSFQEMDQK